MTAREELVHILFTLTPEKMEKFRSAAADSFGDDMSDEMRNFLDFLSVFAASKHAFTESINTR